MVRAAWFAWILLALAPAWAEKPPETFEVSGQVINVDTGQPVPDIEVNLGFGITTRSPSGTVCCDGRGPTRTDASGKFSFFPYKPGPFTAFGFGVYVRDPPWVLAGEQKGFTYKSGETYTGLRIEVCEGGVVSGRVYNEDTQEGIEGAKISVNSEHETTTDANGVYRLTGFEKRKYTLTLSNVPGYQAIGLMRDKEIDIDLRQRLENIDFALPSLRPVSGVVVDENDQPMANVPVTVRFTTGQNGESLPRHEETVTDAQGRFSASTGLAGYSFYVETDAPGRISMPRVSYRLGEAGTPDVKVVVQLPAILSGRVVTSRGVPVEGAKVFWIYRHSSGGYQGREEIETNANGGFLFEHLYPGEYEVRISDSSSASTRVTLAPGQHTKDVTLIQDSKDQ